jgi:hypothetical protein
LFADLSMECAETTSGLGERSAATATASRKSDLRGIIRLGLFTIIARVSIYRSKIPFGAIARPALPVGLYSLHSPGPQIPQAGMPGLVHSVTMCGVKPLLGLAACPVSRQDRSRLAAMAKSQFDRNRSFGQC